MIEVKNIYKTFGKLPILKGISLEVKPKEIISIIGASGAGKTTLLQIMSTIDKPDSGEVLFNNKDVFKLSNKSLSTFRNQNIGFVFQFHHLLPEFTAFENVCIPAYLNNKKEKKKIHKEADELFELLKISNRKKHKPSELSGGEQQRVAVARALINQPEIIFADEPSGNLDTANANDLHQLFFDLRNQLGQTFVIVTHNKDLAAMADRTIQISDGIIVNN